MLAHYSIGSTMVLKKSYLFASVITILVIAWVISGQFGTSEVENAETVAAHTTVSSSLPHVRAKVFTAKTKTTEVLIRGRTEAVRKVQVRTEAAGAVVRTPFEKGSSVKEGDVLCELSLNARDARMAEAEALMRQRWLEFDASQKLAAKGHRSETKVASARAAYDAARAQVKQREVELANTRVTAPFDGIYEARLVEAGDYMKVGDACATLIDLDPFLVVGQVSEIEVSAFHIGDPGTAILVTGEVVHGKIRFVGRSADEATRTFRIELEVPNEEHKLRDGVTAQISVPSRKIMAHLIPPSVLTLSDDGVVGVRTLNSEKEVQFEAVTILDDGAAGIWVGGLTNQVTIITTGQEFVTTGQEVNVTYEPTAEAKL